MRLYLFLVSAILLLVSLSSCETEDILPAATLQLDSLKNGRIAENGGVAHLTASLNGKSTKDVVLRFSFAGTAVSGSDYSVSASEIRIPAGGLTGSLTLTALDNTLKEGDKTIIVNLLSSDNTGATSFSTSTITLSDDDIDTDGDGISDAEDHCPLDSGSVANNGCPPGFGLIINEVLYDPAAGTAGDANGDGVTDKYQDGFVEFFNNTNSPQDLSGFSISDLDIATNGVTQRYLFPPNTLLPAKKSLIVFGGGTPTGTFGGATVLTVGTTLGLSMQNSGEKILVKDPNGVLILTFDSDALSNNPDESYTRNPDISGDFAQHGSVVSGKLFSPGTKSNGDPF